MKKDEILAKLAAGELGAEEASRLLDEAEQEKRGSLYCKVSQKGGVSVYGLQRMPVTLYVEQWERLLDFGDEIRKFIGEHEGELKRKGNSARSELFQNRYRISALLNYYLAWRGVEPKHGMRENYFTCWIYREETEKLTKEFGEPKPKTRDS